MKIMLGRNVKASVCEAVLDQRQREKVTKQQMWVKETTDKLCT